MFGEAGRHSTVATIYAQREPGGGLTTTVSGMELDAPLAGRALVVIVDDRTAHGNETDSTGPLVTELLTEAGFLVDGVVAVTSDEVDVRNALNTAVIGGVDLVVSVGGTGVSPRDVTPDVTAEILDREIPGISEALRSSGLAAGSLDAGLSRGLVGVSGSTLVVNLASSRAALLVNVTAKIRSGEMPSLTICATR